MIPTLANGSLNPTTTILPSAQILRTTANTRLIPVSDKSSQKDRQAHHKPDIPRTKEEET